jgi:hypothetical protein
VSTFPTPSRAPERHSDQLTDWVVSSHRNVYREEGVLVLSGGLTAHNLRDRSSFSPETAKPIHKEFDAAIHEAMNVEDVSAPSLVSPFFADGCRTVY